ncbi:MAG: hypothetical protein KC475_12455, partial [Cyanobacteria bacterium HKST-UBA03]|nr:hypothetical protein [Cyanobacteria bacterium HKST-UBA03]
MGLTLNMGRLFGLISRQIDLQDKLAETFDEVTRIAELRMEMEDKKRMLQTRMDQREALDPALMDGILPPNYVAQWDVNGDGRDDIYRYDRQLHRFVRLNVDRNAIVRRSDGTFALASNPNEVVFVPTVFDQSITADGIDITSGRNIFQDTSVMSLPGGQTFAARDGDSPIDANPSGGIPAGHDQISSQTELEAFWGNTGTASNGAVGNAGARQGAAYRDNLLRSIIPVASTVPLGQGQLDQPTEMLVNMLYNHYAASGTAQVHGPAPIVGNQSRVEHSPAHLQTLARLLTGTPSGNPVGSFAPGTSVLGGQFVVTPATAAQPIVLNDHVANNLRVTDMANVNNFAGADAAAKQANQTQFIQALASAYYGHTATFAGGKLTFDAGTGIADVPIADFQALISGAGGAGLFHQTGGNFDTGGPSGAATRLRVLQAIMANSGDPVVAANSQRLVAVSTTGFQ